MKRSLLIVSLVALLTACTMPCNDCVLDPYRATATAGGSVSLDEGQGVIVTATIRLHEPLPTTYSHGNPLSVSESVQPAEAATYAVATHVVGLPGNFDPTWAPIWPNDSDPDLSFLKCTDGACVGEVVMYATPYQHNELQDVAWPAEFEWELQAAVSSTTPLGDLPVEVEVISEEVSPMHRWAAAATVDMDDDGSLFWQAVHFDIDLPSEWIPRSSERFSSWVHFQDIGGDSRALLDKGVVVGMNRRDRLACESKTGCESFGLAVPIATYSPPRTIPVSGSSYGIGLGDSEPVDSPSISATATADPDLAYRRTFSGEVDDDRDHARLDFSINLDHSGHTDGWPVIAYTSATMTAANGEQTVTQPELVLTDCRQTPCTGEVSYWVPQDGGPFTWQVEAVAIPWSNEEVEGLAITVALDPP